MRETRLNGVIAASATPVFPDYSPDPERLMPHLRHLLETGCDAINLLGTTGEANSFGVSQRVSLMCAVKDAGLPMERFMVGTGVSSLAETVTLTQAAADLGFAGALVLPPFFYPNIDPAALVAYFDELVARLKPGAMSLYLYHIPQNTGVPWPVEVVSELSHKHPELLRGIKDSSGDLTYSRAVVEACRGLAVFPSSEATLWNSGREGFAGCISATTNLTAMDSQYAWTHQATEDGKSAVERATAHRSILGRESLVASVKAALSVLYKDPEWARTCLPLLPRSAEDTRALAAQLRSAGLPF